MLALQVSVTTGRHVFTFPSPMILGISETRVHVHQIPFWGMLVPQPLFWFTQVTFGGFLAKFFKLLPLSLTCERMSTQTLPQTLCSTTFYRLYRRTAGNLGNDNTQKHFNWILHVITSRVHRPYLPTGWGLYTGFPSSPKPSGHIHLYNRIGYLCPGSFYSES